MFLLELDPNIVKPGWTPFLILIGLAAVMYLLFRSMRRQFRRVEDNYAPVGDHDEQEQEPGTGLTTDGPGADGSGADVPGADGSRAAPTVESSPPQR